MGQTDRKHSRGLLLLLLLPHHYVRAVNSDIFPPANITNKGTHETAPLSSFKFNLICLLRVFIPHKTYQLNLNLKGLSCGLHFFLQRKGQLSGWLAGHIFPADSHNVCLVVL